MANMGLLGALGGLGQGLQTVGRDIYARRERALEEARKEAEYQRRLADVRQDKQEARQFDIDKTAAIQGRQDARFLAGEQGKDRRLLQTQTHQAARDETKFSRDKELIKLRNVLDSEKEAKGDTRRAQLKKEANRDDVATVQYGKPNAEGYAEVIFLLKDGSTRRTGIPVYKPKLDYAPKQDEDEDEDQDTL
jgi:hypothetical protein